jgi:tetratricopeptide (TPR) repeat protein
MGFLTWLFGARSAENYLKRGRVCASKAEYDKAIAAFTDAIRLNPKFTGAYRNRGGAYFAIGEYHKASADCIEAIWLDPTAVEQFSRMLTKLTDPAAQRKARTAMTDSLIAAPPRASAFIIYGKGTMAVVALGAVGDHRAVEPLTKLCAVGGGNTRERWGQLDIAKKSLTLVLKRTIKECAPKSLQEVVALRDFKFSGVSHSVVFRLDFTEARELARQQLSRR